MKKLEALNKNQLELIPKIKNKWINRFNSLPKLDKDKAQAFAEWFYETSNLKKPSVIFVDSPLAAQIDQKLIYGSLNSLK